MLPVEGEVSPPMWGQASSSEGLSALRGNPTTHRQSCGLALNLPHDPWVPGHGVVPKSASCHGEDTVHEKPLGS